MDKDKRVDKDKDVGSDLMGKRSKYWPQKRDSLLHGGCVCLPGRALLVDTIVRQRRAGESVRQIADWYEIPMRAVQQALEYAELHPEEFRD